jgi:hypothetical protein
MRKSGARVRTIRTTCDGVGRAYGIITGMAATPNEALAELWRNAEAQAESLEPRKLAEQRALREMYEPFERSGPFEVVDVHVNGRRHGRGRQRLAGLRDIGQE